MEAHKLLAKQLTKYLTEDLLGIPDIQRFVQVVNDSYEGFDRDRELSSHAFKISEQEYQEVNDRLSREVELRRKSIEKLKDSLSEIAADVHFQLDDGDLIGVVDFLNKQITKRKQLEEENAKTANLLTTLVTNINSGIMMEDENRRIVYINKMFCDMFSIVAPPDTLIGKDYREAQQYSKILFKDQDGFVRRIQEVVTRKKVVTADELELANGRFYERTFVPIFVDNKYSGHLWKYSDITERKNNERKLRESRLELKRLSLVASANTNGVLFTDFSGKIFWSNEGFLKLTGYESNEIMDKTPIELGSGSLTDKAVIREMVHAYQSAESFSIEIVMYRKDGSWFWARVNGQPVIEDGEGTIRYFSLIEDITQVKIQEEKIQRLSLVAQANSKGVFILTPEMNFSWVNHAYEEITGFKAEEIIGTHPAPLFSPLNPDTESISRMEENSIRETDFTEEFIHLKKDGSSFWGRINVQFVKNEKGETIQRFGVLEDISHEKEAENALKMSEEKYRSIIANMNLGLLEVDLEDRIQFANQSFLRMSGYGLDELVGKEAALMFTDGANRDYILAKKKARLSGQGDAYEVPVKNRAGELKWWLISGAPRLNQKGEVVGTIGIHLDITNQKLQEADLKEAREQAEESSKSKAAFLANMSHEIRTPLNAITGMLRELSKSDLIDKQRVLISNAEVSAKHLLSIINNILDISKIEAGEFQIEELHFSLAEVINDTTNIISGQTNDKGLDLNVNLSERIHPTLIGDPGRIRQILINLIGNAIKFTEKGHIDISCEVIEDLFDLQKIKLSIEDTGIGMDKSYLNNLFNKFSQEDRSTARKYGGTGLGMAITYELVQLMHGNIVVSSEKNKGTRIEITIPLKKGVESKVEVVISEDNFEKMRGIKLLLVEDNEWNRMVANHSLSMYDVKVTEAENGKIALKALQEDKFDIVLMDIQMPVMDGFEATTKLRKELKIKTPVIALTANAFKKETDHCLAIGMNDYIIKPYDEKTFFATIVKNLETTKANPMDTKLYDLSELMIISRGDKAFTHKMIQLFVDQVPQTVKQISEALQQQDYTTLKAVVHRIKPSLANMGIHSLKDTIKEIEENPLPGESPEILNDQIALVLKVLEEVKIGLEGELNS